MYLQGIVGNATGWGPWVGGGMAASDPDLISRLYRQGRASLDTQSFIFSC